MEGDLGHDEAADSSLQACSIQQDGRAEGRSAQQALFIDALKMQARVCAPPCSTASHRSTEKKEADRGLVPI